MCFLCVCGCVSLGFCVFMVGVSWDGEGKKLGNALYLSKFSQTYNYNDDGAVEVVGRALSVYI